MSTLVEWTVTQWWQQSVNTHVDVFVWAESDDRHGVNLALWTHRQWRHVSTASHQRLNQHLVLVYRLLHFLHMPINGSKTTITIIYNGSPLAYAFSASTLLVGQQEGHLACKKLSGVVICLEQGADLHMAQLMPLPLTVSCFCKIQIGFTFLVPAHLGSPGKRAVKRVCVCVCVCALLWQFDFGDAEWLAQTSTVKNSVIWLHCWPLDQSVSSELTHRWVDLSCWQVDLSTTWPAAPRSNKILSMSLNYHVKCAWWKHIVLSWTECSEPQNSVAKNSCQLYLCSDGVISWSTGNTHLQWLYKNKGKTKKKDVIAKHLCTWMAFSHSVRLN